MMRQFNKFRSIRKGFISPNIIFSTVGYILLGSNFRSCFGKLNSTTQAAQQPSVVVKSTHLDGKASGLLSKEAVSNTLLNESGYSISLVYGGTIGLIKMQQGQSDKGLLFLLTPDLINRFAKLYQKGEDTYDSFIETIRFIKVDGPFLDKLSKEAGIWPYGNNKALRSVISSLRRYPDRDDGIDASTKVIKEVNKDSVKLKCNVNPEKLPSGATVAFVLVKNAENISFIKSILENPAQYTGKKEVLERYYRICLASVDKDSVTFSSKNPKLIPDVYSTSYLYVKDEKGNHASLIPLGNVQIKNNIGPSVKKSRSFCFVNYNISPQGNKRPLDDNMDNKSNPDSTSNEGTPPEDEQPTGSIGNEGNVVTALGSSNSTQNPESENSENSGYTSPDAIFEDNLPPPLADFLESQQEDPNTNYPSPPNIISPAIPLSHSEDGNRNVGNPSSAFGAVPSPPPPPPLPTNNEGSGQTTSGRAAPPPPPPPPTLPVDLKATSSLPCRSNGSAVGTGQMPSGGRSNDPGNGGGEVVPSSSSSKSVKTHLLPTQAQNNEGRNNMLEELKNGVKFKNHINLDEKGMPIKQKSALTGIEKVLFTALAERKTVVNPSPENSDDENNDKSDDENNDKDWD